MTLSVATHRTAPISGAAVAARRASLLMAILISGGNLLIPRVPVLGLLLLFAAIAFAATPPARERQPFLAIYALLGAVLLASLYRSGLAELSSLVTRYANFGAGLALLAVYLRAGRPAFSADLGLLLAPLAWISIGTVVLSTLAPPLFQPLEVQETIYYQVFLIFNYHITIEDAGGLMRPNGPFYEPGVFHIYLNLYLYLCLFVLRSRGRAVIAGLAVLATQSTTGLAIGAGLVGYYFWRQLGRGSLNRRVGMLAIAVALAAVFSGPFIENVRSKFIGDMAGSSMSRQFDLITGINVVLAHPLAGIGFDPETYRQLSGAYAFDDTLLDDRITEDRGNTNGILVLLYSLGIPLALPFLWGLFRQTMLPDKLLVGGLLFVSLLTESIALTPFFLLFQFSGLLLSPRLTAARRQMGAVQGPVAAQLLPGGPA